MRQALLFPRVMILAGVLGALISACGLSLQAAAKKGPASENVRLSPSELPADRDGAALLFTP
ncbi:MAG TPA: hypothetical protein VEH77_15800, partial [Roseiarcus sp.]|nr:hypothetical protein [Roseiarcus sp.]